MVDLSSKLSGVQRDLLVFLYAEHADGGAGPGYDGCIHWRIDGTDSERATLSRALRRLERRGLLLRLNFVTGMGERYDLAMRRSKDDPHNRTTHIKLLPPGVEVGKQLTNQTAANANRLPSGEGGEA
jgi:DNA-binding MarR family transcriptional regulator